jgi:aspartate kinase
VIAAHQTPRNVDVQFVLATDDKTAAIAALHKALIPSAETGTSAAEPLKAA